MEPSSKPSETSLLRVLQNSLILRLTSPYIGLHGLISLAAASKSFRNLTLHTPQVFSRVDLSNNKLCLMMTEDGDERHNGLISYMLDLHVWPGTAVERTFNEYLARPLDSVMGHLVKLDVLLDLRILILDGLAVPDPFLYALLCGEVKHNIRMLSIRGVKELHPESLARCIRYLIRSSRPHHPEGLQGLYYLTPPKLINEVPSRRQVPTPAPTAIGVTNSVGARLGSDQVTSNLSTQTSSWDLPADADIWYNTLGEVKLNHNDQLWADLLDACEGLIAFDATVCRHDRSLSGDPRPKIANIRLSSCQSCDSSPEGTCLVCCICFRSYRHREASNATLFPKLASNLPLLHLASLS